MSVWRSGLYNSTVTLTPFSPAASPIRAWLAADGLGQRFLGSYLSDAWEPLVDFKKRHLWIAEENREPVGFFDLELDLSGAGYFVFYVAPEFRANGYARKILECGLATSEAANRALLEAGVEPDNAASRHILESFGLKNLSPDEDGMLAYRRS